VRGRRFLEVTKDSKHLEKKEARWGLQRALEFTGHCMLVRVWAWSYVLNVIVWRFG